MTHTIKHLEKQIEYVLENPHKYKSPGLIVDGLSRKLEVLTTIGEQHFDRVWHKINH